MCAGVKQCKCETMQIGNNISMKDWNFESMQFMQNVQVCLYANVQDYRYWVINYASMKICKYSCLKVQNKSI